MNRLVQGDVGSGKTIVAGLAAYNVALAKKQTAILAPTVFWPISTMRRLPSCSHRVG